MGLATGQSATAGVLREPVRLGAAANHWHTGSGRQPRPDDRPSRREEGQRWTRSNAPRWRSAGLTESLRVVDLVLRTTSITIPKEVVSAIGLIIRVRSPAGEAAIGEPKGGLLALRRADTVMRWA